MPSRYAIARPRVVVIPEALVTYAKARFKLAGGQTGMIRARLDRQGRKLTQTQPTPTMWANVTFTGSRPVQVISRQITLTH